MKKLTPYSNGLQNKLTLSGSKRHKIAYFIAKEISYISDCDNFKTLNQEYHSTYQFQINSLY